MSGVCPFALNKLIKPGANDPAIKPRAAILHVDAGNAFSLFNFFKFRSGGIESHFHVRKDGVIEQYRDIYWEADANFKANRFGISIETQGFGAGTWNDAQLASIKKLLLWLNQEAGIPLQKIPTWDGSGIGYHVQFGAPGPWTPVAKSCPGPDRIKQYHNVIVPWLATVNKPKPAAKVTPPPPKEYPNRVKLARTGVREAIRLLEVAATKPSRKKDQKRLLSAVLDLEQVLTKLPRE